MPATRKSSRGGAARAAASRQQSTLSFNHKITKSGAAKSGKTSKLSTPPTTKVEPEPHTRLPTSEDVEEFEVEQPEDTQPAQPEPEKSEVELSAEKVTDAQIKRYWKGVEAARISKRVHQEDLSQAEKVLRYFDVSSQYGPCIGVPRAKRWYRAEKLGLNPPIEVLAVLLREERQGNKEIERAAMDRLMESTAIGSG
ncbi:putative dna polymerase delta [Diaporthe ampelina]|uniref:Putative dna polymerase delta n=1 Tax=Diaporthe ampelina TaxID=1214573 RepID=A0A0G2FV39_9PEZI|nr:putative dna polymerase delta [Diaporthe ampelina]